MRLSDCTLEFCFNKYLSIIMEITFPEKNKVCCFYRSFSNSTLKIYILLYYIFIIKNMYNINKYDVNDTNARVLFAFYCVLFFYMKKNDFISLWQMFSNFAINKLSIACYKIKRNQYLWTRKFYSILLAYLIKIYGDFLLICLHLFFVFVSKLNPKP